MMRLLHLPNEKDAESLLYRQVGARRVFTELEEEGVLAALKVFSYVHELKGKPSHEKASALMSVITDFAPDVLFIQHVNEGTLPREFWGLFASLSKQPFVVYHDEDAYSWPQKRIRNDMRAVLQHADLTLISATGPLLAYYRRSGAKNIRYLNHYFDKERNGRRNPVDVKKVCDAIMIGSRGRHSTLPMLYLPGGRRREQLVKALTRQLGERFHLYGSGWDGLPSSQGFLPWADQESAIQSSRVSVNWDHYDRLPDYCSDRLPISLAAGVPHVTTRHVGYESLFDNCPGLYACTTVGEVLECVQWLLSRPQWQLDDEGLKAKEWVFKNLEASEVFRQAIDLTFESMSRASGK